MAKQSPKKEEAKKGRAKSIPPKPASKPAKVDLTDRQKQHTYNMGYNFLFWTMPVLVFLFFFVGYTIDPSFDFDPDWFFWHPVAMSAAIFLAAIPGILIRQMKGRVSTKIHTYMMLLSTIFLLIGYYVIYTHKEEKKKAHLTTTHGQLGFVLISVMTFLTLVSFPIMEPDWHITLPKEVYSTIKKAHKWIGRGLMLLSGYVLYTGFDHKVESDVLVWIFGVLIFSVLLITMRSGFKIFSEQPKTKSH